MAELSADLQALLNRVAEGAALACGADDVLLLVLEGEVSRRAAHFGPIEPLMPETVSDDEVRAAISARATIYFPDVQAEEGVSPQIIAAARAGGIHTVLHTPLIANEQVLGQFTLRRREVRLFTGQQIAQLETYAALAGLAIDRARLASELDEKTREQAETLEERTATNHILEIISQSPTGVQPMLDAICETAARVCGATDAIINLFLEGVLATDAHYGPIPTLPIRERMFLTTRRCSMPRI